MNTDLPGFETVLLLALSGVGFCLLPLPCVARGQRLRIPKEMGWVDG